MSFINQKLSTIYERNQNNRTKYNHIFIETHNKTLKLQ